MASANFTNLTLAIALGNIAFGSGTFKAMLITAAPDETALDTWIDRADVTTEHAATGGYTAGGFDVTVSSVVKDDATNRTAITFSASDPTYSNVTISGVIGCLIYLSTGVAANDLLVAFVDFGSAKGVAGGEFTVSFSSPLYINR